MSVGRKGPEAALARQNLPLGLRLKREGACGVIRALIGGVFPVYQRLVNHRHIM